MIDKEQLQTKDTFGYKWGKTESYGSEQGKQHTYNWLVERYFGSESERLKFLDQNINKSILDAGCGSAYSAFLLFSDSLNNMEYLGVDISEAIEVAKARGKELNIKSSFLQEDIGSMQLNRKFDIIFSEGVIHHTSNPCNTFKNLVSHLKDDGLMMFYVYKKKAPVREFTDDYIRDKLQKMDNAEAWNALYPLTKLGKKIGDLNIEIEIEEDIELLEIPKGRYNIQRLLYYYFVKQFYDERFTIEEMNCINFDWFRPLNCYRFFPHEIEDWLSQCKLQAIRFVVEDSGITVVAKKQCAV